MGPWALLYEFPDGDVNLESRNLYPIQELVQLNFSTKLMICNHVVQYTYVDYDFLKGENPTKFLG